MDWRTIKETLKDISGYVIVIAVVFLLMIYVVSLQQIVGPSMSPTLGDQQVVLLNKMTLRFRGPKRNEIIAFNYEGTKYLVKRVIGLPGEHIEYKDNTLYIDGAAYKETFLGDDVITDDFNLSDLGYDKIPDDMYFVLGDNRQDSLDSNDFGLISKKDILGKAFFRIWPIGFVK